MCDYGLSTVCMFLEDSTVGREVLRQAFPSLLHKVDQAFSSIMEQEVLRNGDACYNAVKVGQVVCDTSIMFGVANKRTCMDEAHHLNPALPGVSADVPAVA